MTPALAEAARHGATVFSLLAVGDRFAFQPDHIGTEWGELIKTGPRSYRHACGGRQWQTGAGATCYRIRP